MASIRRTLSPVPRPGTALNGEVCSVGSPLSRSSTCAQSHSPSGGVLSALSSSLDSQAFVLSVFSPRTSRPVEKSKNKGHAWRRAIFQFCVCFVVGVFIGFTPFSSMNFSSGNLISKHQAFSFEMVSAVGNFQPFDSVSKSDLSLDDWDVKKNSKLESRMEDVEPLADTFENTPGDQSSVQESELEPRKLLIIVTPTYARTFQAYYLNRLAHTLKLVPSPLLWLVVEMTAQSAETAAILRKTGVMYRHLVCSVNLTDVRDRNVHQRNVALKHIETHQLDGIVYFANDENVYSTELFDQLRQIRRFGIWKVAKVAHDKHYAILDGPVCNGTEVIGWHVNEPKQRYQRFHAEISGFAFNSTILWDSKRWHRPMLEPIRQRDTVKDGLQVSTLIEQIVEDESQMEGLMQDCSSIMVWHLRLESANSIYPHDWVVKDNLDVVASFIS